MIAGAESIQKVRGRSQLSVRGQDGITLVELLIVMSILTVVTSMILMSWIALQKSYAQTSRASQSREFARDAVARMTQEIRDAQGSDQGSAITEAGEWKIVFYSTYNTTDSATTNTLPRQTAFVYQWDKTTGSGKIYRVVDANGNGLYDELGADDSLVATNGRVVVDNVVNCNNPTVVKPTSVFTYSYYDASGVYTTDAAPLDSAIINIRAVHIRVLVDMNPGHSPVYMDLQTTAQPRNMRPAT